MLRRVRPLGVDPARARPAPALRREAAAADRAQSRPRRPGAEGHGGRGRPACGRGGRARGARGRGPVRQHRSARRSASPRPARSLSVSSSISDRRSSSQWMVSVLALTLEDRDQFRQPGARGPDVLQAIFLEELIRVVRGRFRPGAIALLSDTTDPRAGEIRVAPTGQVQPAPWRRGRSASRA